MAKNKKVMSIAIRPELHEELKRYSKRKATSASSYVGDLIEKALKLEIDDEPVVIGKSIDEDDPFVVRKRVGEKDPIVIRKNPEEDVKPILLKIPRKLIAYPDKLRIWMKAQVEGIAKQLTK
jgi:hypothetical protein